MKKMKNKLTAASLQALQAGVIPVIKWGAIDVVNTIKNITLDETGLCFEGATNIECTIQIGTEQTRYLKRYGFTGVVHDTKLKSLDFDYLQELNWNEPLYRAKINVLDYLDQHYPDLLLPKLEHLTQRQQSGLPVRVAFEHKRKREKTQVSESRFLVTIETARENADTIRGMYPATLQHSTTQEDQPDKIWFHFGLCPIGWDDLITENLLKAGIPASVICGASEDGTVEAHEIFIRHTPDKTLKAYCVFDTTQARIDELSLLKIELQQLGSLDAVEHWIDQRMHQYCHENELTFETTEG